MSDGKEEGAASDSDPDDDEANITGANASAYSAPLPEFIAVSSSEDRATPRRKQNKSSPRGGGGRRVGTSPVDASPLHSSRRFRKFNSVSHLSKQSHQKHSKKQRN